MNRTEKFLRLAYENTFHSTHHKALMAAVAVHGNRVIAIGTNQSTKTHPRQKQRVSKTGEIYGGYYPHAELDCLIRAGLQINGATVYVARRLRNLDIGLAKPCKVCIKELKTYGVKKVYYTLTHSLLQHGKWYDFIDLRR